jgi:hypothetical protein
VTYAPGPSFRKLMDRIDAAEPETRNIRERSKGSVAPIRHRSDSRTGLWRPPGLAWAASFILAVGLGGFITSAYRPPIYITHTDPTHVAPKVLHVIFNRSVTIGEVEEALRSSDAHLVEGPDSSTGVIGVEPNTLATGKPAAERISQELAALSARLRADPRVRWVEPVSADSTPGDAQAAPTPRGQ